MAVSVAECDVIIQAHSNKLKNDPEADPEACRKKIDYWLDRRIDAMEQDAIQSGKRREEVFAK